jgi:hypothetical protein
MTAPNEKKEGGGGKKFWAIVEEKYVYILTRERDNTT